MKLPAIRSTINYDILGPDEIMHIGTASIYRDRPVDSHDIDIQDFRGQENDFSIEKNGFELQKLDFAFDGWADDDRVKAEYYPAAADFLKKRFGAAKVVPFSHVVRTQTHEEVEAAAKAAASPDEQIESRQPSRFAHIDHTAWGSDVIGQTVFKEDWPSMSKSRWAIINIWRPIATIVRDPLCVADRRTIAPDDLVVKPITRPGSTPQPGAAFEGQEKGFTNALYGLKFSAEHKWWYCSGMKTDEVLLLQIYDSSEGNGEKASPGAPHCSFVVPGTEEMEPRRSCESRFFVFWEDN